MTTADTPRTSVVVVTYNSKSIIDECLSAVVCEPSVLEVIVVDNASTDGTLAHVRSGHPDVIALEAGGNLGFAAANNIGVSRARGEHLLLLNPDAVVTKGAVRTLSASLADESLWVVGPCIVDGAGAQAHSYGDLPGVWWALTRVGPGHRLGLRSSRVIDRRGGCDEDKDVGFITGASMMTRRDVWTRLGGLSEDYFLYFEDTDYCARVHQAGGRVRLITAARVAHLEAASFGDADPTRNLRSLQGLVLYLARHASVVWAELFRVAVLLEFGAYWIASFIPSRSLEGVRRNRALHARALEALTVPGLTRRAPRAI